MREGIHSPNAAATPTALAQADRHRARAFCKAQLGPLAVSVLLV